MTAAAILLTVLLPLSGLTEDARALIRALAREQGCPRPVLAARTTDGFMEVQVTCRQPGEEMP